MANTIKWLWLTLKKGISYTKITALLNEYGDIDRIYNMMRYDLPCLNEKDKENLLDKSFKKAKDTYRQVIECGASILTCDSPYFPQKLLTLDHVPYVLYVIGQPMDLNKVFGVGVVGTRINTRYGAQMADKIAYGLGENGITVISGMASGIDGIAMNGALRAGATVIGVLGCGIDVIYPKSNRKLFDKVKEQGLIISEYPPGIQGFRGNFPQRNRIIAALSKGVLVIEGSKSSGSMITADYAKKYGRDVFAVPRNDGDFNNNGDDMDGANVLLKDGAKPVTSAEDILEAYSRKSAESKSYTPIKLEASRKRKAPEKPKLKKSKAAELLKRASNDTERVIIQLLENKELYADEISEGLNTDISSVGVTLTIMETMGLVKRQPDGRYVLNV